LALVAAAGVGYGLLVACDDSSAPGAPTPASDGGVDAPFDAGADPASGPDAAGCASKHASSSGACQPLVFVTTALVKGDLGGDLAHTGVERGDALCQAEADKVFTGKVFKAWLSGAGVSAKDRLEHSDTTYRVMDGTPIATSWNRFASPIHTTTIDLLLDGTRVRQAGVYTGTKPDGTEAASSCNGWSSQASDVIGTVGFTNNLSNGDWSSSVQVIPCTFEARLYCIEQVGR
jgi:hypothetical protein